VDGLFLPALVEYQYRPKKGRNKIRDGFSFSVRYAIGEASTWMLQYSQRSSILEELVPRFRAKIHLTKEGRALETPTWNMSVSLRMIQSQQF
jgi:hypothetical protein